LTIYLAAGLRDAEGTGVLLTTEILPILEQFVRG
jgi:hypothetical protein